MPNSTQFGLIMAYLLPGFIGLAGIAPLVPAVKVWFEPTATSGADVAIPLYALLAAVTVGMVASCFRWLLVDFVHERTGVRRPVWDDRKLEERLAAFNYLVEAHYRYYQFVANTLVALMWSYVVNRWIVASPLLGIGTDVGIVVVSAVLFAASRDALKKYYSRTGKLIGWDAT